MNAPVPYKDASDAIDRLTATAMRIKDSRDELREIVKSYAAECNTCDGTGIVTGEVGFHEDCPDCFYLREAITRAK